MIVDGLGTHVEPLRVWVRDDATSFQVEVSDAASHGEPPVNISYAHAVPLHKTSKTLDPVEEEFRCIA